MVILASLGEIAGAATTAGAMIGGGAGMGAPAAPASGGGTAVVATAAGARAGCVAIGGGATEPEGVKRRTISTPLRPSGEGSFAAACWRRKSIASRILASRNSMRGITIVFSLLLIRAVPVVSF